MFTHTLLLWWKKLSRTLVNVKPVDCGECCYCWTLECVANTNATSIEKGSDYRNNFFLPPLF